MTDYDLFAGPGGWDVAARLLGRDPVGVEDDPAPIATRKAAGLRTIEQDVRVLDPHDAARIFGPADLLIGSPPCPDWSVSNRRGANAAAGLESDEGALVLEVLRWAKALRPRAIVCEQVPKVLPVWHLIAAALRDLGYVAGAWIVNAADFGVPQARRRAILSARLDTGPLLPTPTHERAPAGMFVLEPWVTMAAALRDLGPFSVRWAEGEPYEEGDLLPAWCYERPSTTVTSAGRVPAPGYRKAGERQFAAGSLRLTVEQAARLQSFPDGYPWQAPRAHEQVGNAVPPTLARALLSAMVP